jgi:hypothetical protein
MSVTQEMIDALLAPEADSLEETRETGRKESRIPFRGRAKAVVYPPPSSPDGKPVASEVVTTDISRSGLSLLYRKELHPGQRVLLRLKRVDCTVEVCWCCRVWPGLYIAGCRFLDSEFADAAN